MAFADTRKKTLFLLTFLIASICITFWLSSRYPALNLKALMGGDTSLSGIGFETLVTINKEQHSALEQIVYTTLNWMYTNQNGMTFGLLLAPAVLLLFNSLQPKQSNNRILASTFGALAGAPLGVCANCVAPIAISLHQARARLEITLSMIVSSPTLNIIAITMLFSTLPFYLAVLKLLFTAVLILLFIPLITKFSDQALLNKTPQPSPAWLKATIPAEGGWLVAIQWVITQYLKKACAIGIRVIPLMILAGIIGAVFITFVPAHVITGLNVGGYPAKIFTLFVVSGISTLIPAPMTFDIIMAINLRELDTEVRYVAAILFGLGAYSIYPYFLLLQNGLKTAAHLMFVIVTLCAFTIGCTAHFVAPIFNELDRQKLEKHIKTSNTVLHTHSYIDTPNAVEQVNLAAMQGNLILSNQTMSVARYPFNETSTVKNGNFFNNIAANSLNLSKSYQISINSNIDETYFKSIVSEDINNDHLPDILFIDHIGLRLFINQGKGFQEQSLPETPKAEGVISFAAIVDINNDKQQDIVFAVENTGIFSFINQNNGWSENQTIFTDTARFVTHLSFADLNTDGKLDILLGNWTAGSVSKSSHMEESINTVLLSSDDGYTSQNLGCRSGETLTTLLSKLTSTNQYKLIIGNDFAPPDCYYTIQKDGTFNEIKQTELGISHNPLNTMGYESADFNNDGQLDVFGTDTGNPVEADMIELEDKKCQTNLITGRTEQDCLFEKTLRLATTVEPSMTNCLFVEEGVARESCVQFTYMQDIIKYGRDCDQIPDEWPQIQRTCMAAEPAFGLNSALRFLDQTKSRIGNVLYIQSKDSELQNKETDWHVQHTGWAWNAQAADINNDGWQDLYISTGYFSQAYDEANRLYVNDKGNTFIDETTTSGANSYSVTNGYTYIDLDFDGDQDIITNPISGPLEVFENQTQNNAIAVQLIDESNKRTVIGATLRLKDQNTTQYREVKLSGGFAALSNTRQYFGLGDLTYADQLEVQWPDGTVSTFDDKLEANALYVITRKE